MCEYYFDKRRPSLPRYCYLINVESMVENVASIVHEKKRVDKEIEYLIPYEPIIDG